MEWLWDLDQHLFYKIHVLFRSFWLDVTLCCFNHLGNPVFLGFGMLLLALFGKLRKMALQGWVSITLAKIIHGLMIPFADRMRPSHFIFSTPLDAYYGNTSFPSAHTGCSFALAFLVYLHIRETKFSKTALLLFICAMLVGYSRIYVGVHFPTDVLGGIALGAFSAGATYLLMNRLIFRFQEALIRV